MVAYIFPKVQDTLVLYIMHTFSHKPVAPEHLCTIKNASFCPSHQLHPEFSTFRISHLFFLSDRSSWCPHVLLPDVPSQMSVCPRYSAVLLRRVDLWLTSRVMNGVNGQYVWPCSGSTKCFTDLLIGAQPIYCRATAAPRFLNDISGCSGRLHGLTWVLQMSSEACAAFIYYTHLTILYSAA